MKLWRWFCRIGEGRVGYKKGFGQSAVPAVQVSEHISRSGVDICSRICGHERCQCGGTMKGLYCVWSYYRMDHQQNE